MSNVSKQIYRKLNALIPELQKIEPFTKVDLTDKGYPEIIMVVFDSTPQQISFILSRYNHENGRLIANPSIEAVLDPKKKIANAVTYKDTNYFHDVTRCVRDEVGTISQSQANDFLNDWLNDLKGWNKDQSQRTRLL